MGGGRKRLTRADLEAMVGEFDVVERYGGASSTVDEDLIESGATSDGGCAWRTGPGHGGCRSLTRGHSSDISTSGKA